MSAVCPCAASRYSRPASSETFHGVAIARRRRDRWRGRSVCVSRVWIGARFQRQFQRGRIAVSTGEQQRRDRADSGDGVNVGARCEQQLIISSSR